MKPYNNSPFKLESTDEYLQWRELKLSKAKTNNNKRVIHLKKTPPHFLPVSLDVNQNKHSNKDHTETYPTDSILSECNIDNYCLYSIEDYKNYDRDTTKQLIHSLAKDCGLSRLDGNICADKDKLTSICHTAHKGQREYIPYSNKKLSWHTDGYYNLPANTINSMLLHCFQAAENGGESAFMDHEIAYIYLRDENPAWIEALSQKKVMTIPANTLNGKVIRAEQSGPVFSITPQGLLHMRFTARQKNIVWSKDKDTLDAVEFLQTLLNSGSNHIIQHKLKAGEGIISRNILHCRSAFNDNESNAEQRLLFRGRFYDELPADHSTNLN